MPLTVITLKSVPRSLRGDLTKWMQEIATGVFIGNFNSRVRQELWERVVKNIGGGEATISYAAQNSAGYDFQTLNSHREVVYWDGIPLVQIPVDSKSELTEQSNHMSKAEFFHQARIFSSAKAQKRNSSFVVIDLETDGLNPLKNNIVEIGAVKKEKGEEIHFHRLIKYDGDMSASAFQVNGISRELLEKEGVSLSRALTEFADFCGQDLLIGYNIGFDLSFINESDKRCGLPVLKNSVVDVLKIVKKENMFLKNYKLQTVLQAYGIETNIAHRALEDAKGVLELMKKLNYFQPMLK